MRREYHNPSGLPDWSSLFSQVVAVHTSGATTAFVSGQVGVDERQVLWGDGGLEAQVERAMHNLSIALSSAGGKLGDIVKLTIYVVGYRYEKIGMISAAIAKYFRGDQRPALSLVGVQALARPEFEVEIEAVALFPNPEGGGT